MNEKLNIQNLTDEFAESYGINRKDAEAFIKEFFSVIQEGLEKDKYVKIKGFGTFKIIEVDSRESINVNTGERFEIQGHSKITFTPDKGYQRGSKQAFLRIPDSSFGRWCCHRCTRGKPYRRPL